MGKVSHADKMRAQTLREQGCGTKVIIRAYPYKEWKLSTVQRICRRMILLDMPAKRKAGSGQSKFVLTAPNIDRVEELICSQEAPSCRPDRDVSQHSLDCCRAKHQRKVCQAHIKRRPSSDFLSSCTGADHHWRCATEETGTRQCPATPVQSSWYKTPEGMRAGQWWALNTLNT